jgi:hypothetical protein
MGRGKGRIGTTEEVAEKVIAKGKGRRFLGAEAPRNDKNKGFTTAQPSTSSGQGSEGAPLQSDHNRVFQQPVKSCPDTRLKSDESLKSGESLKLDESLKRKTGRWLRPAGLNTLLKKSNRRSLFGLKASSG